MQSSNTGSYAASQINNGIRGNPFYLGYFSIAFTVFTISTFKWSLLLIKVVNMEKLSFITMFKMPVMTSLVILSLLILMQSANLLSVKPFFKRDLFDDLKDCFRIDVTIISLHKKLLSYSILDKLPFPFFSKKSTSNKGEKTNKDAALLTLTTNYSLNNSCSKQIYFFIVPLIPLAIFFSTILFNFVLTLTDFIMEKAEKVSDIYPKLFFLYLPSMIYTLSVVKVCAMGLNQIEENKPTTSASISLLAISTSAAALSFVI